MIAIPGAAFMGSVAMIVGPAPQLWCNHFEHGRPMIAVRYSYLKKEELHMC